MAEISLRAYTKEVDNLIEAERFEEAISHSRQILQKYPKHLETYRLLGKAFLEAKRYSDATDIFQRVLSAVPGDFVSHIGMAIIREDEGNLDAAIWHMERAFETSPANQAIQQEMRRLLGLRDGVEPPKVRLTRGALAHMYARGELYQQAIGELLPTLDEDPDRPDLQALLAEMYWRTGQRVEAAHVCSALLEKLPYCREANRILASIMQASGQAEEARSYHRRLADLDPYAALVENASVDPGSVDDNAIRLIRLEWRPNLPQPSAETSRQDFATPPIAQASDDSLSEEPSWLGALSAVGEVQVEPPEPGPPAPAPEQEPGDDSQQEEIPTWIRRAGWSEATGEVAETPVTFSDTELDRLEMGLGPAEELDDDQDIVPADIPDWIMDIAPSSEPFSPEAIPAVDEAAEGELPDWLKDIGPSAPQAEAAAALPFIAASAEDFADRSPDQDQEDVEEPPTAPVPARARGTRELPSWLDESDPGASETIVSWLGSRAETPEAEEPVSEQGTEPMAQVPRPAPEDLGDEEESEVPTWLTSLAQTPVEELGPMPAESWGAEPPDAEGRTPASEAEPPAVEPVATPEDAGQAPLAVEAEPTEGMQEGEETIAWLREYSQEPPEEPAAVPEPAPSTIPGPAQEILPVDEPEAELAAETAEELGWLMDEAQQEEAEAEPIEQGLTAELPPIDEPPLEGTEPGPELEAEGSLDWLEQIATEDLSEFDLADAAEEEQVELPDWLQDLTHVPSTESERAGLVHSEAGSDQADQASGLEPETEAALAGEEQPTEETDWFLASEEERPPQPISTGMPGVTDWLRTVNPQLSVSEVEQGEKAEPIGIETQPLGPLDLEPDQPAVREPAAPEEPSPPAEESFDPAQALQSAREALQAGQLDRAADAYSNLVKRRVAVPTVIDDLVRAVEEGPGIPAVWQALGDAYMKADRVGEAIEAYRRGMEAL